MAGTSSNLLRLVQERASAKKKAEEEKKRQQENCVPYVPTDCVSNILCRLPLQSLQQSRFVCKPWYKIINNPNFIDAHLSSSEITLIFLSRDYHPDVIHSLAQENSNTFSIEAKIFEIKSVPIFKQPPLASWPKYKMLYMEIREGKCEVIDYNTTCLGQIRASCNGLIVLDNALKNGELIALNPVTRKMIVLPLGSIFLPHKESYALAFCNSMKRFKLVHLFFDVLHYIGCEILDIGTRSWRVLDEPRFGPITWLGCKPVHAIAALHWVPHIDHSEYLVSLSIDDENFHKIILPKSKGSRDGIVEIRGLLGFITHEETYQIDVWVLNGLLVSEKWTKHHSIVLSPFSHVCATDIVPLCCTKIEDELVFWSVKDRSLHSYKFQLGALRKVEMRRGLVPFIMRFIPHVNSLVSWEIHGEGDDMDD